MMEPKGKFKCKACAVSLMSKKHLEKHRKTAEHKTQEKTYLALLAREKQQCEQGDAGFLQCEKCGLFFISEIARQTHE